MISSKVYKMNGYKILKEHLRQNEIANKYEPFRRYCSCGHSVYISKQTKFIICKHCGKKIYFDEKDKKHDEFMNKMRRLLNE